VGKISAGIYYFLKLLLGDEELSRLTTFLKAIENRGKTTIFPATRMTRKIICRNQIEDSVCLGLNIMLTLTHD